MDTEIHDDVFGILEHDAFVTGCYQVKIDFSLLARIELTLDLGDVKDEDLPRILESAHKTYFALQKNKDVFFHAIAEEFLTEYNHICKPVNPINEQQFLSNINWRRLTCGKKASSLFVAQAFATSQTD